MPCFTIFGWKREVFEKDFDDLVARERYDGET
jgi:hypothetical protein